MQFRFCYTQLYDGEEVSDMACTQTTEQYSSETVLALRSCNSEGDKL